MIEFRSNFTEICSQESDWHYASIDSGNGYSVLNRRQFITWTNDDPVHRRIYAALGEEELTPIGLNRRYIQQLYVFNKQTNALLLGDTLQDLSNVGTIKKRSYKVSAVIFPALDITGVC